MNQRLQAEQGFGPFEGPSYYSQLCWWSLIIDAVYIRGVLKFIIKSIFFSFQPNLGQLYGHIADL
jgi:hypothetical protein